MKRSIATCKQAFQFKPMRLTDHTQIQCTYKHTITHIHMYMYKYKYNLFKDWRACKEAFEGGQVVPVSRFTDPSQAARTASDAKELDRSHSSNVATCHASKVNFKQTLEWL